MILSATESIALDLRLALPFGSCAVMPRSRLIAIMEASGIGFTATSRQKGIEVSPDITGAFEAIADKALKESGGKPVDLAAVLGRIPELRR